jgi:hypothetical protein
VTLRFQKASCVVVGTFNMYILHPQWLAKHGIIDRDTEVELQANFTQPGMRIVFPGHRVVWNVTPNRLVVDSQDREFNCGSRIANTLAVLPETPLFAIGNNFRYQADLSEMTHLSAAIRDCPRIDAPVSSQHVVQRTFHVAVEQPDHETVNLQIALKEQQIELACNVHRDVGKDQAPHKAAVTSARRFLDHRAACESLAHHFFGTSIDHGSDNT